MKQGVKRLFALFLAVVMCVLPASAVSFGDVKENAYYAQAVTWAVSKGVTDGFSDGTFRPDATCTRGQVVTFIWRANGKPEPQQTANPFSDVDPASPFYKAILWACEKGITNGTSPTAFNPSGTCTRGQIVTFIWRANGQPSASGSTLAAEYDSGAYYANAVAWADNLGLLGGTGTPFKPGDACPRADVVTYLYRNANDGASNRSKAYTPDFDKWEVTHNWNGTSKLLNHGNGEFEIQNSVPNHAMFTQIVSVKPHMDYIFTAVLRIDNYQPGNENPGGACIVIMNPEMNVWGAPSYVTSGDVWTAYHAVFNPGSASSVRLCLSNGWVSATSSGTAYFKEITLEERGTNEVTPMFG